MQTAKNVFLWPGRDWLRNGFEAWFTALIELAWGRRRIIEIYLNVVEWGPGVYEPRPPRNIIFTSPRARLTRRRRSVSRRRSPIRSAGRRAAPAAACSPAARRSARTCRASPRRCPCPAGREGRSNLARATLGDLDGARGAENLLSEPSTAHWRIPLAS